MADQGWTWAQGQGSHSCTHRHPGDPILFHFQGCISPLRPSQPPPRTFLAPPHGILLPQGDLHVEGVAVVPEGDPGRVLQRLGAAAAVAPLVRAGGTWGAHGALEVGGGGEDTGCRGPTARWGSQPHWDACRAPEGPQWMPPLPLGRSPPALPPAEPPGPPPASTCSELADAPLQLGVAASRAPAPVRIHVGAAGNPLGLPVLPVGVEEVLLRQPRVAPASLENRGEEKVGAFHTTLETPIPGACPLSSPRCWPTRSRAEPAGC